MMVSVRPVTLVAETEYMRAVQQWVDRAAGFAPLWCGINDVPQWSPAGPKTEMRRTLTRKFAFSIPSRKIIDQLVPLGPFVEVGAGTGYWAYELQQSGADIIATDRFVGDDRTFNFEREWLPIEELSAKRAAKLYADRTLFIAWPDDFNQRRGWSDDALEAYQRAGGKRVVYIGESAGGCTGSDRFHDILEYRWHKVLSITPWRWEFIYDEITVHELGARPRRNQLSWAQLRRESYGNH